MIITSGHLKYKFIIGATGDKLAFECKKVIIKKSNDSCKAYVCNSNLQLYRAYFIFANAYK